MALAGLALVAILVANVGPAEPEIERQLVLLDVVRRGDLVLEVRGPGTLVPEHIRWVSALTPARVERIFVQPGADVGAGTVLLELANPDVQIEALDAERQLTAAEGELVNLRSRLQGERLTQAGVVATTRSQYLAAVREAAVAESLSGIGGLSRNDLTQARERAEELEARFGIERQRLDLIGATLDSQLAVQRQQVVRLRGITAFRLNRLEALQVRAGADGVLQELPLQVGQWVVPGAILAKVVQPGLLKAVVRIPEGQASGLAVGQSAAVDARTGVVPGHVVRIDPAAQAGAVSVDIALDGPLPAGARPDMSVDAEVTIEKLGDVLSVGRPAYGQPNGTVGIFKLVDGGRGAVRVPVSVGRASSSRIEILRGLEPGDSIILSALPQFDGMDRIRFD